MNNEYGYLCLTRFPDQIIRIGDDIRIKVMGVQGRNVRLGIRANKNIVILREEVYQRDIQKKSREGGFLSFMRLTHEKLTDSLRSSFGRYDGGIDEIEEGE